jgi:endonuclease YncB( thermonuclease family)
MKYAILLLLSFSAMAADDLKILRVVDADTFIVSAPFLPPPLKPQMPMRLNEVDTPGVGRWANCDKESKLGNTAKFLVEDLLKKSKSQKIQLTGIDKYGRLLGIVYLDNKKLSEYLLNAKLARSYNGGTKTSWCN